MRKGTTRIIAALVTRQQDRDQLAVLFLHQRPIVQPSV